MLNILIIMTGEGVSNYEFKSFVAYVCILAACGCASESSIDEKKKKLKSHKVILIKTLPSN